MDDDIIAALASAPGPSMRGIIRVSGDGVHAAIGQSFQPDDGPRWGHERVPVAHSGKMSIDGVRVPLDASVLYWPGRRSYTGQPMAEIHTVGSPPLLEAVLAELYRHGIRPAQPGEFTLRAFLAGRIDLAQAEAVLGVIDAEDQHGLTAALKQLAGGLSLPVTALRDDLLDLLGDLEAGLDFVEEDIEFVSRESVFGRLHHARDTVDSLLAKAVGRSRSTGRRTVVLAGLPNAGKSTLFNALCETDAAIVSTREGTTRDFLAADVDWGGLAIELVDTAGWDADETGVGLAAQQARGEVWNRADLIVWCSPADAGENDRSADDRLYAQAAAGGREILRVATKCDAVVGRHTPAILDVSAHIRNGLPELREAAVELLSDGGGEDDRFLGSTAARTRGSLEGARESLSTAIYASEAGIGEELVAAEIRETLHHLGALVGEVYTDDLLDRIFSKFCIGK